MRVEHALQIVEVGRVVEGWVAAGAAQHDRRLLFHEELEYFFVLTDWVRGGLSYAESLTLLERS